MNKKALIVTSALVLGTSSVAMADSFSFGARASVSFGTRTSAQPVIRDHRDHRPAPVYRTSGYEKPYVTVRYRDDLHWDRPQPRPIPAGLDCRNWDPTVDTSDACMAYSTGYVTQPYVGGAWALLGVRESSVADNQFITVNDGRWFGVLKLRAEQGSPFITKVAVRFTDNTTQVINLGGRLDYQAPMTLSLQRKPINQIVIYTAAGSHGAYSVAVAR